MCWTAADAGQFICNPVSSGAEREMKHETVRSESGLYDADRIASALAMLRENDLGVVLRERDLEAGTWIDMVERLRFLPALAAAERESSSNNEGGGGKLTAIPAWGGIIWLQRS
jgi:hypothetical protein